MTDETSDRIVHGAGVDGYGPYEVVRYRRARHWQVEYLDAEATGLRPRRVRVWTAARLAATANRGLPGGFVFDRLWRGPSGR